MPTQTPETPSVTPTAPAGGDGSPEGNGSIKLLAAILAAITGAAVALKKKIAALIQKIKKWRGSL
jgi:hypothetical protein